MHNILIIYVELFRFRGRMRVLSFCQKRIFTFPYLCTFKKFPHGFFNQSRSSYL